MTTIRNCGQAPGDDPVVRFEFLCPRTWDSLRPGTEPNVRHCDTCRKEVYYCAEPAEAAERAVRGECIAIPSRFALRRVPDQRTTLLGVPRQPHWTDPDEGRYRPGADEPGDPER